MEEILARAGSQAMSLAIRSGITLVSGYAIKGVSKFLEKLPEEEKTTLEKIRKKLKTRINIITPSIDLIQLLNARGYTLLQSTVSLTRELRDEINEFDEKMEHANQRMALAKSAAEKQKTYKEVEQYMLNLLQRIDESVQLLQLAITTSGANVTATLPDMVSPARLLQAAMFMLVADSAYTRAPTQRHQVGPTFSLKMYTIFYGTARNPHTTTNGDITWKEEHAKCFVEIFRVPIARGGTPGKHGTRAENRNQYMADNLKYRYELVITENLDDGRYHEELENPGAGSPMPEKDSQGGGIRGKSRTIPLSIVTRLFFSASGRLLDIEEAVSPVLVMKLNKAFLHRSPYYMFEGEGESGSEDEMSEEDGEGEDDEDMDARRVDLPSNTEWLAFELYTEEDEEEEEEDEDEGDEWEDEDEVEEGRSGGKSREGKRTSLLGDNSLAAAFSRLSLSSSDIESMMSRKLKQQQQQQKRDIGVSKEQEEEGMGTTGAPFEASANSLSLLEYIIRLAALQTNDQSSVFSISDERISLYLRDDNRSASTASAAARDGGGGIMRDMTDPIGPGGSPSLSATRFSDTTRMSGGTSASGRSRRSRSSTPVSAAAIKLASGSSSGGGQRERRRSSRLSSPLAASNPTATAERASRGNAAVYRVRGEGGSSHATSLPGTATRMGMHSRVVGGMTPSTPTASTRLRHRQYGTTTTPGGGGGVDGSAAQLTPWELDRLKGMEGRGVRDSPLNGKTVRAKRKSPRRDSSR